MSSSPRPIKTPCNKNVKKMRPKSFLPSLFSDPIVIHKFKKATLNEETLKRKKLFCKNPNKDAKKFENSKKSNSKSEVITVQKKERFQNQNSYTNQLKEKTSTSLENKSNGLAVKVNCKNSLNCVESSFSDKKIKNKHLSKVKYQKNEFNEKVFHKKRCKLDSSLKKSLKNKSSNSIKNSLDSIPTMDVKNGKNILKGVKIENVDQTCKKSLLKSNKVKENSKNIEYGLKNHSKVNHESGDVNDIKKVNCKEETKTALDEELNDSLSDEVNSKEKRKAKTILTPEKSVLSYLDEVYNKSEAVETTIDNNILDTCLKDSHWGILSEAFESSITSHNTVKMIENDLVTKTSDKESVVDGDETLKTSIKNEIDEIKNQIEAESDLSSSPLSNDKSINHTTEEISHFVGNKTESQDKQFVNEKESISDSTFSSDSSIVFTSSDDEGFEVTDKIFKKVEEKKRTKKRKMVTEMFDSKKLKLDNKKLSTTTTTDVSTHKTLTNKQTKDFPEVTSNSLFFENKSNDEEQNEPSIKQEVLDSQLSSNSLFPKLSETFNKPLKESLMESDMIKTCKDIAKFTSPYYLQALSSHIEIVDKFPFSNPKFRTLIHIESDPNGHASILHAFQHELNQLNQQELEEFAFDFCTLSYYEDEEFKPSFVMGIVHEAICGMPDFLDYLSEKHSDLTVTTEHLGRRDTSSMSVVDFRNHVKDNFSIHSGQYT